MQNNIPRFYSSFESQEFGVLDLMRNLTIKMMDFVKNQPHAQ